MNQAMTQAELQQIEHANKVLREHLALRQTVKEETEQMIEAFIPSLQGYVETITDIRKLFGEEVRHILQSARELKTVSGHTQELVNFISQVHRLNEALTPDLVEKLNKLSK